MNDRGDSATYQLTARPVDSTADQHPISVLDLTGEIDASNAKEFDQALRREDGSAVIVLDLSAAQFFDSAGFAVLDRRLAGGGLLVVISPGSLIRRAAALINVPFYDSVSDALAAARSHL